ncbi:MAG: FHA domain-containing protein [Proteobacteria bacterium]|nr:FHA domain-containing protein [Pseudomonadota bacterium]
MIVCPRCGRDNQVHFRFCLGCGAELGQAAPLTRGEAEAPTLPPGESPLTPSALTGAPPTGAPPAAGAPQAGAPLVAEASRVVTCPGCGQTNPAPFAFCGGCGARLHAAPAGHPSAPGLRRVSAAGADPSQGAEPNGSVGRLALIRPDGSEGDSVVFKTSSVTIGRDSGPPFAGDHYLGPQHVRLHREGPAILVEDTGSLNGVFVRIVAEERLRSGDIFRVGQELLRFDAIGEPAPTADGTEVLGSPNPGYWGRLSLLTGSASDGGAFPLMGDEMALGRERGDILFSDDGYVSAMHAKVMLTEDGRVCLVDLGSSNGTFIRLRAPRTVPYGTLLLLGQQLFRIETA